MDNCKNVDKLRILGYQENLFKRYNNISINLDVDNLEIKNFEKSRIVTFNCFDTTVLYIIFKHKNIIKLFYTKFSGCQITRNEKIFFYEIKLFDKLSFLKILNEPSYICDVKFFNVKSKNQDCKLHYNWNSHEKKIPKDKCLIELLERQYELESFTCIFCLRILFSENGLNDHINTMHLFYKSSIRSENNKNVLVIKRTNPDEKNEVDFAFRTKPKSKSSVILGRSFVSNLNHNKEFDTGKWHKAEEIRYFYSKRLEEIIDVNQEEIELMKAWNDFIIWKRTRGKLSKPYFLTLEFTTKVVTEKKKIFDLLELFYAKSVLLKSEVIKIIEELTKKMF